MSSEGHFAVGLVEAHLGRADPARLEALEGLRVAEAAGEILLLIPNLAVLGFLELSLGRPAEADAYLSRAVELERAMGVREPAYFRIVPDEVEALVALGRLDEAEALLAPFEDAGRSLDRAWAIATGARCRALVLAARGDLEGASAAADEAVRHHDRLPLPFELGRTLLVSGAVQRRAKRKREARDTLTQASGDLRGARRRGVGGQGHVRSWRGSADGLASSVDLTPTEARVAELVAAGQHQPRGGRRPVRQRPHRGGQSQADLPQAGHPLPHGTGLDLPIPAIRVVSKTYRSPSRSVRISGIPRVGALSSLGIRDRYPSEGGIMSTKAGTMAAEPDLVS